MELIAYSFLVYMSLLIAIRALLVLKHQLKAIDYVYSKKNWKLMQKRLHSRGFMTMIFDLRKWTYKQFYPEFIE